MEKNDLLKVLYELENKYESARIDECYMQEDNKVYVKLSRYYLEQMNKIRKQLGWKEIELV